VDGQRRPPRCPAADRAPAVRADCAVASSGVTNDKIYDSPITQEQLADATGLTPVHTNRTLQTLRRAGLISLSSNLLKILDWNNLCDVGDFSGRCLLIRC